MFKVTNIVTSKLSSRGGTVGVLPKVFVGCAPACFLKPLPYFITTLQVWFFPKGPFGHQLLKFWSPVKNLSHQIKLFLSILVARLVTLVQI